MDNPVWILLRGIFRGIHLAGYFATFGTMFFSTLLLPEERRQTFKRLLWGSFAVALLTGAAWFFLQSADFVSATSFSDALGAVPIVAQYTRFGHLLLGRTVLLVLSIIVFLCGWRRTSVLLALGGVIAEAWLGHGGAMEGETGTLLLGISILHLTAAAIWLGMLPALYLVIRQGADAVYLARKFSIYGMICVVTLLLTAFAQYLLLIATPRAMITSAYGTTALAKLVLFMALIALAARNKLRLTPQLPAAKAALLKAIAAEIVLGLIVLLAAGLILQFAPPAMSGA